LVWIIECGCCGAHQWPAYSTDKEKKPRRGSKFASQRVKTPELVLPLQLALSSPCHTYLSKRHICKEGNLSEFVGTWKRKLHGERIGDGVLY
jgi:hypothetical protein